LQAVFTRLAVSQDSLPDTLADSLRRASRLDGNWLRRLPIDDPRHALVLIPGVRLSSIDIGITPTTNMLIRGDATGRGNVYVDGALMRFETRGGAGVELAPNAVDTLSLLTGPLPRRCQMPAAASSRIRRAAVVSTSPGACAGTATSRSAMPRRLATIASKEMSAVH